MREEIFDLAIKVVEFLDGINTIKLTKIEKYMEVANLATEIEASLRDDESCLWQYLSRLDDEVDNGNYDAQKLRKELMEVV